MMMSILARLWRNLPLLCGILCAVWFLVQPVSLAQTGGKGQIPPPEAGWIRDRADLLSWPTEHHLNRRINLLKGRTRAELAIATLPQLPTGTSAHEFALDLFNTWGIGDRRAHTGVLLLVSQADRHIEIMTGRGLGEILPDADVSQLIQQELVPAFRQQRYSAGITAATQAIAQRLEAQLPSAVLPPQFPDVFRWLPWIVAAGGIVLAGVGGVQAIAFSLSKVTVSVPIQGMNITTFARSSQPLAADPLPRLLAQLFTPDERDWEQEIPYRPLGYLWIGGMVFGVGLIRGFWQWVLLHPDAQLWQRDAIAWVICAGGSSAWLLGGVAVTCRFIQSQGAGRLLLQQILVIAAVAGLEGYIWVYQIPTWPTLLIITGCFGLVGWLVWRIIVGDELRFKRQRLYCSDRSDHPVQELTAAELAAVLTPDEILAQSMNILEFRGWREASLVAPLSREQVYLIRRSTPTARVCERCQSFAIDSSTRTVERTIETRKQRRRKPKETVTSTIQVTQNVYTCRSCGHVAAYDQRELSVYPNNGGGDFSTTNFSLYDGGSSYSSNDSGSYDTSYSNDYGSSSGSDFGGGSSDGGGAGSDW